MLFRSVSLAGRKSIDFFGRRDWPIRQEWPGVFDRLSYEHALDIGQNIIAQYNAGTFDRLFVVYNEFKSVMAQRVVVEQFLPIQSVGTDPSGQTESSAQPGSYLYEPDEYDLFDSLLPKHFEIQTFRVLLESAAAEQAARMTAMDGATRNAGELIKKLTLTYNKRGKPRLRKNSWILSGEQRSSSREGTAANVLSPCTQAQASFNEGACCEHGNRKGDPSHWASGGRRVSTRKTTQYF